MSDDEDKTYHLPAPNMDVFGADEPAKAEPAAEPKPAPAEPAGPTGTMRFQDAASTRPRPPSLAEQRARAEAEEELATQRAEVERKAAGRRKVMIGGGVTVGVVALVGAWYLLASPQNVTARCTADGGTGDGTVVQDQYCDADYVTSHGGHITDGIVFLPLPGGGFSQYRYYYGGTGAIGQRVSGGSFSEPANANVRTGSGQTIQRGGFGITGKGGSGGSGGGGGEEGGSHSGGS